MATTAIGRFMGGVVIGSGGTLFAAGDLFVDRSVLEGEDVDFEAEACYVHNGAALTSIEFVLDDGVNTPVTKTKAVTDETLSSYTPKYFPNKTGKIVARFTGAEIATLDDGIVTLTITFTPATGTAAVVSHEFLNNAGSTRTIVNAYVDQATGNDANGALSLGDTAATIGRGIRRAATTNNPAITDPTLVIPVVHVLGGTYSSMVQASNGDNLTWVTIKPYTGHEGNVIISCVNGAYIPRCRFFRFKGIKIDVADGTGSKQFCGGHAQFVDGTGKPGGVWLDDCDVYHGLGRSGQLSANATFVNRTSLTYGAWWTRGKYHDMNQAACKEFRFVRDILIQDTSNDSLKDADVICEAVVDDNSPEQTVLQLDSVTGATVGGIVYGTTSTAQATIVSIRATETDLVISGAIAQDFKQDDNVSSGIQFYAAGQTPGVDTPAGTTRHGPLHPDLFQLNNGSAIDNAVYSNWLCTFVENQLIFPSRNGHNMLFRNIVAANAINSITVSTSQIGDGSEIVTIDHIVFENCTIPNQDLQPRHILTDVKVIHTVFSDFLTPFPTTDGTASGLTIEESHATDPAARYTSSRGAALLVAAPAYDEDATEALNDFSPSASSPLLNGISSSNRQHKYYIDGTEIPNDGTGAIGAYALASDPAPTWQLMSGETAATLTIADVQVGDFGRLFRCVATNGLGSVTSNEVTIIEE